MEILDFQVMKCLSIISETGMQMPAKEALLYRNTFRSDKKSYIIFGYNTVNTQQCDEYEFSYIIRKL